MNQQLTSTRQIPQTVAQLPAPRRGEMRPEQFHPALFDSHYADPPQPMTVGQRVALISGAVVLGLCAVLLALAFGPRGDAGQVGSFSDGVGAPSATGSPADAWAAVTPSAADRAAGLQTADADRSPSAVGTGAGAAPTSVAPTGGAPSGDGAPSGGTPDGQTPDDEDPGGEEPGGELPDGEMPDDLAPQGEDPGGVHPTVTDIATLAEVDITSPAPGLLHAAGTPMHLAVTALNPLSGNVVPGSALHWTVKRGGSVIHTAVGSSANVPGLKMTPGSYSVRVEVEAPFLVGSDSMTVTVPFVQVVKPGLVTPIPTPPQVFAPLDLP